MAFKNCKNQKGVTLIEVLISVALLGIIATVFTQILNNSILLRTKSDLQAEASAIAMSQIEALKQTDTVPAVLNQVSTVNGFDVVTTLTDVTTNLVLNDSALTQGTTNDYNNQPLSFSIGKNLTVANANDNSGSYTLNALENRTIRISIRSVTNAVDTVQYELTYDTPLGNESISLGTYGRLDSGSRFIKITRLPDLVGAVSFEIDDNTREPLQFGIFEDNNHQITVTPAGTDTSLTVNSNLSEQGDPNRLTQQYYEILVTVSRNGQTYARLLSTWAVKGD